MKDHNSAALELPDDIEHLLEIHPDLPTVEITVAVQEWGPPKEDNEIAKDWVKKVRAIYYTGGKPSEKVVIGLVTDTGVNYKEGEQWSGPYGKKVKKHRMPIRLLQICIGGQHVLFFYSGPDRRRSGEKLPKCLVDLLIDSKTMVVAVGMKALQEKLEKYFELELPRTTDPSRLAAYYDHAFVKPDGYDNLSVLNLADKVYRDAIDKVFDHNQIWNELHGEEKMMHWWDPENYNRRGRTRLSTEKIETGALEAYLAYAMGKKLLSRSWRIRLSKRNS